MSQSFFGPLKRMHDNQCTICRMHHPVVAGGSWTQWPGSFQELSVLQTVHSPSSFDPYEPEDAGYGPKLAVSQTRM